ncbi:phosphatidylserine/phosphatidylglycerophosphate/cardiolipin synthase family protein [Verrucomicrobiaceae bacterium 227]
MRTSITTLFRQSSALVIPLLLCSCSTRPDSSLLDLTEQPLPGSLPLDLVSKIVIQGNVISAVRNPFTTIRRGLSFSHNRALLLAAPIIDSIPAPINHPEESIEVALDRIDLPAPIPGRIDYLIDGPAFFPALHDAVEKATRSVETRVYIYGNDHVATRYSDLLKKKSSTIPCRVLMDDLGSLASWWDDKEPDQRTLREGESIIPYLEAGDSKVRVRKSRNPFFMTDHSKVIIVDGQTAFLGGMNIAHEYRYDWHDMMARLQGPVVKALRNDFNRAWRHQGGGGDWTMPFFSPAKFRTQTNEGEIGIRILKTGPHVTEIEDALITAIQHGRKRIYLQNPYFTSGLIQQELIAAKKRGLDVRVIFSKENDSKLLGLNNQSVAKRLVESGIATYLYPKFSHVKAIVVDDWTSLGSANLDALSLYINDEVNVAFSDPKATSTLVRELFLKDFEQSKKLGRRDVKDWDNPLSETISKQF